MARGAAELGELNEKPFIGGSSLAGASFLRSGCGGGGLGGDLWERAAFLNDSILLNDSPRNFEVSEQTFEQTDDHGGEALALAVIEHAEGMVTDALAGDFRGAQLGHGHHDAGVHGVEIFDEFDEAFFAFGVGAEDGAVAIEAGVGDPMGAEGAEEVRGGGFEVFTAGADEGVG